MAQPGSSVRDTRAITSVARATRAASCSAVSAAFAPAKMPFASTRQTSCHPAIILERIVAASELIAELQADGARPRDIAESRQGIGQASPGEFVFIGEIVDEQLGVDVHDMHAGAQI